MKKSEKVTVCPVGRGWRKFWEAYTSTEEVLNESKDLGVFDYVKISESFPQPEAGETVCPGVELLVKRGPFAARIIRHLDPLEEGFNSMGGLPSRILRLVLYRRAGKRKYAEIGDFVEGETKDRDELVRRAKRDPALQDFLDDVTAYLS